MNLQELLTGAKSSLQDMLGVQKPNLTEMLTSTPAILPQKTLNSGEAYLRQEGIKSGVLENFPQAWKETTTNFWNKLGMGEQQQKERMTATKQKLLAKGYSDEKASARAWVKECGADIGGVVGTMKMVGKIPKISKLQMLNNIELDDIADTLRKVNFDNSPFLPQDSYKLQKILDKLDEAPVGNKPLITNAERKYAYNILTDRKMLINTELNDLSAPIKSKALKSDPLIQEARKYTSADEFVKSQGTPVYHGTSKQFNKFDVGKANQIRTKEFGGINAVYLSEDSNIAMKYAKAPQSDFFDSSIINDIKSKNKALGDAVEKYYKYGHNASIKIDKGDTIITNSDGYSLTQAADIAAGINGSKLDHGFIGVQGFGGVDLNSNSAFFAKQTLDKLGLSSKIEKRVLSVINDGKIKDLGYIEDYYNSKTDKFIGANEKLTKKALTAKKQGYDGIKYQTEQSIDNTPEIAIWNTDKIKTKSQLKDIFNRAHKKLK